MAREVLDIFFEVFGYRGQWPLELKWHRGECAQHEPVYSSVTPDDFAKLALAQRSTEGDEGTGQEPLVVAQRIEACTSSCLAVRLRA